MSGTAALPIGIVLSSFEPGGTERQMIELIRRLDPDRWAVHVACTHARGAWLERAAEAARSVEAFPLRSLRRADTLLQMRRFARWCTARQLAVVHTCELYSNIFALPAAALAGVKVRVGNRREINPDKSAAQIAAQRVAYSFAHKVATNSHAAAARLAQEFVPRRKIAVIPNGVDLDRYEAHAYRRQLRRVVMVANLRPEKGHDVLIDASVEVLKRFPNTHFDIVGTGPQRIAVIEKAHATGVAHAFTFAGHDDNVAKRLADADMFVLPSRSEAFPNALLEAMAAGLPVVASGVGGILELVEHNHTGLMTPAGDAHALAKRICQLVEDPQLAGRLGRTARATVRRRFSFDRMVGAFESLYLAELSRRGVVPAVQPQLAAS
ncbi:MAG TPA: glycosyltransferase [Vicinamibacterales bacterium]|jgi:glycosyltransferase involved in cell wall biosynthesis|nr:glycosyltransferase [Vicinamibacterales bacterium]